MEFIKYVASRFFTFMLVILIGITAVFFLARVMPSDPVENMISQVQNQSGYMDPGVVSKMREVMTQNFGLEGTSFEQYFAYMKRVIFTQDFGPSFSSYPTPVVKLIGDALPWTFGLLLSTTLLAFIIGNAIGLLAGMKSDKLYSKILEWFSMILYPIPYYIIALVLSILFSYVFPIFPLVTTIFAKPWTWQFVREVVYNSFLPALSLLLIGTGWWVLSMRTLSRDIAEEDFVTFARQKGLSGSRIMTRYVMRNAMPSQVTILALRIGSIFSGSMLTEIIFSYPGLGTLTYKAILSSDYNLMMGTITLSIITVSLSTFLIDLFYPLLDPRVRYK